MGLKRETHRVGGLTTFTKHTRPVLEATFVVALAAAAGWASTGKQLPFLNASALLALAGVVGLVVLFIAGARMPSVPFAALLVMFPLGDYLRKAGSGDPRLILSRDLLLIVGVVVLTTRVPWRDVLEANAAWLRPLAVFVAWFGVGAVNSALFQNVQVPFVGLRLYFEYLPLIGVGWYVARDATRLRRAVVFVSVVLCATTYLGLLQSVLGPGFLANANANSDLFTHLNLLRRTAGQTAGQVFQPTGLFVEPGRFADWAFVNFAFGLALVPHRGLRWWRFVVPVIGALGLFAASNRTTIVAAVILALIVALRQSRIDSSRAIQIAFALTLGIATLAVVTRTYFPEQFESRVQFVGNSLNVTSASAEGSTRVPAYAVELYSDIGKGGLVGRGAGTQGLGRQYLGSERNTQLTEGGFAVIMVETGVMGFLLWIFWTGSAWRFARRAAERFEGSVGQTMSTLATALAVQLFVIMFIGISAVQDFVFNSWLFLVLGFVAAVGRYGFPVPDEEPAERTQPELITSNA